MAQLILADDIIKQTINIFKIDNASDLFSKIPALVAFIETNYSTFQGSNKKQLVLSIVDEIGKQLSPTEQAALQLIEPALGALIDEVVSVANSTTFQTKVKSCFSCCRK